MKWILINKKILGNFSVSRHRLSLVQRKTLVLDLDETLIHSHHDGLPRNPSIKPGIPHDFTVSPAKSSTLILHLFIFYSTPKNQFFIHKKYMCVVYNNAAMLLPNNENFHLTPITII